MTMAVFDFSAIKARMERRPVLTDDKTEADCVPKFANIPLSQVAQGKCVTITVLGSSDFIRSGNGGSGPGMFSKPAT